MARGGLGESDAGRGASKDQDEAGRKKRKHNEACQASRKRVKQDKDMLKGVVSALNAEMAEEEIKFRSLDQEGSMMTKKLELLKTRKTELKGQIGEKEKEVADQNEKLEDLSKHPNLGLQLGFSSLDLEMLRNELAVLTPITNWDDWESEKAELEKEISELEMENIKLKTQCQILGEKIIQDWKQGNPSGY